MAIALDMAVLECERYVLAMPRGEIDACTGPAFQRRLFGAIGTRPLIIDMTEVTFFDCTALKAVVAAERRCRSVGSALAVAGLRPSARQIFRLAGVGTMLPLCTTIQEAVWCVVPLTDAEIASWTT